MAYNTTTSKKGPNVAGEPVDATRATKSAKMGTNYSGKDTGQMRGNAQPDKFARVLNPSGVNAKLRGMEGLHNDIGEMSGFITDGYLDKQGTPFGEAAKFNFLPPGMDISNQENVEIHEMPMVKLVDISYPGDGWSPAPRDIPE